MDTSDPTAKSELTPPGIAVALASLADEVASIGERLDAALAPPALLTVDEVAGALRVSKRTVETLVALGEIPVVRIGAGRGVRRFERRAVDAFVRRSTRSL